MSAGKPILCIVAKLACTHSTSKVSTHRVDKEAFLVATKLDTEGNKLYKGYIERLDGGEGFSELWLCA